MKFVILSRKIIPDYGVSGPILSPAEYDIHQVLRWVHMGLDVREVMEDGSYRKLKFNDERLLEKLNEKIDNKMRKRKEVKENMVKEDNKPKGFVQLKPENKKPIKTKKIVEKKEEPKEEVKQEIVNEELIMIIDELEKPE